MYANPKENWNIHQSADGSVPVSVCEHLSKPNEFDIGGSIAYVGSLNVSLNIELCEAVPNGVRLTVK